MEAGVGEEERGALGEKGFSSAQVGQSRFLANGIALVAVPLEYEVPRNSSPPIIISALFFENECNRFPWLRTPCYSHPLTPPLAALEECVSHDIQKLPRGPMA